MHCTTSAPPVPPSFDRGVQVFISVVKAELLAQHFERTTRLILNIGAANHTQMIKTTNVMKPLPTSNQNEVNCGGVLYCITVLDIISTFS
jgi:hypothetical protein